MQDKELPKIALIFSLIASNILFLIMVTFIVGYCFGFVGAKSRYQEGVKDGEKKGRYEIYIELERRNIGEFNFETRSFEFNDLKKGE